MIEKIRPILLIATLGLVFLGLAMQLIKRVREGEGSYRRYIIIIPSIIVVGAVCLSMPISNALTFVTFEVQKAKAVEEIKTGIISNKEIVNAHYESGKGMFGISSKGEVGYIFNSEKNYVPTEYRIYISAEYEIKDKKYTEEKYFTVSENIYNKYNIGETFDSTNL